MPLTTEFQILLSLTAGILGALIATSLKTYFERIRWKIENVYLPLYGRISTYYEDELIIQERKTDEYFLPLLKEFEDEKVVLISSSIREDISTTNKKIALLNKYIRIVEDELLEDAADEDGTLPDSIIHNGGGQPGSTNLVYTWNDAPENNPYDQLPDLSTTVVNWVGNNGRVLVKAKDAEELRQLLINNQNWGQRWRHKRWTEDEYVAIFKVISRARERWKKETEREGPSNLFEEIKSDLERIRDSVSSRTKVRNNII